MTTSSGLSSRGIVKLKRFKGHLAVAYQNSIQFIDPLLFTYKDWSSQLYLKSKEIILDGDRSLRCSFGVIDYMVKTHWFNIDVSGPSSYNEANDNGDFTIASLKPGDYSVTAKILDDEISRKDNIVEFSFSIPLRWYERIWLKIAGALLLLFFGWKIIQWRVSAAKRKIQTQADLESEIAQIEFSALQSQMNPHFVFNALNSIQNLVSENRVEEANNYLTKFSSLLRSFLRHSELNMTTLADELELNRNYLDLEKLRFKEEMEYSIHVDGSIDVQDTMIPTVMIQPFLENAIRHGIFHKKGLGVITLTIDEVDDALRIRIADNGIGMKKSKEINAVSKVSHDSRGLKLLERKKELLKVIEGLEVKVDIKDLLQDNKVDGTEVQLTVNMKNHT